MKTKSKWTEQRDAFFVKQFDKFFKEWKDQDRKKNTQGEFARQICEIRKQKTGEQCPVTNSYVSEWARGKWFPDQYLPEIAEVLGVKEEEFFFQTHDDFYKYSSEYMTKVGRDEISQFCDDIGLDLRFLYIIRELIGSDFDDMFPTWTPLHQNPDLFSEDKYIRRDRTIWSESAEMDPDVRVLQYIMRYEEDGETKEKLIPFTHQDLRFIKDVQNKVVDYIEFLMMKQGKDLKREAKKATNRSQTKLKNGGIAFRPLNAEELNEIDTYCNEYVDQKDGDK